MRGARNAGIHQNDVETLFGEVQPFIAFGVGNVSRHDSHAVQGMQVVAVAALAGSHVPASLRKRARKAQSDAARCPENENALALCHAVFS